MRDSDEDTSIVGEYLKTCISPLLSQPADPTFVYPAESFPPLSSFDITLECNALIVPSRLAAECRKKINSILLNRRKLKVIYPLGESDKVPGGDDPRKFRKLLLVDRQDIYESPEVLQLLQKNDCCKGNHEIRVSYSDWTAHEALTRILPVPFGEIPSAFESVGHLAHINVKSELLPYKYIIGKVLLDKNSPRVKSVVNKIGTIETEYRTFGMEVIAGSRSPGWSKVTVKEEKCQFSMDFRKVYWNSRLAREHRRLTDLILKQSKQRNEPLIVADLMAGIGPFAVPLTSKGSNIQVYANDLNPDSYEYLVVNSQKNRCQNLRCYNMDARAFCRLLQETGIDFHHAIMNLPASAPEFLDAFRGFKGKSLPRIHVHCFARKDYQEGKEETVKRCEFALGCKLHEEQHNVSVISVRNVSPKKNMYCVSFNLPVEARKLEPVTCKQPQGEPNAKRPKLNT